MDDNLRIVLVAALAAIPPTVFSAAALWRAIKTHKLVNSRMTELLAATKASASAEATLAEKGVQARRGHNEREGDQG